MSDGCGRHVCDGGVAVRSSHGCSALGVAWTVTLGRRSVSVVGERGEAVGEGRFAVIGEGLGVVTEDRGSGAVQ